MHHCHNLKWRLLHMQERMHWMAEHGLTPYRELEKVLITLAHCPCLSETLEEEGSSAGKGLTDKEVRPGSIVTSSVAAPFTRSAPKQSSAS